MTARQIFGNNHALKEGSKEKVTTLYLLFFSCEDLAQTSLLLAVFIIPILED